MRLTSTPRPSRPAARRAARAATLLVGAALGACTQSPSAIADGNDPLAALRVNAQTTRYTDQWWRLQADSNPALYRQAVDYCKTPGIVADGPKPNCGFVQLAANKLSVDSLRARGTRMESSADQVNRSMFKP